MIHGDSHTKTRIVTLRLNSTVMGKCSLTLSVSLSHALMYTKEEKKGLRSQVKLDNWSTLSRKINE